MTKEEIAQKTYAGLQKVFDRFGCIIVVSNCYYPIGRIINSLTGLAGEYPILAIVTSEATFEDYYEHYKYLGGKKTAEEVRAFIGERKLYRCVAE